MTVTPERLAQLEYVLAASDAVIGKYLESGLRFMSEPEKTVCVVWLMDTEIKNGGFDQYFFNSSGDTSVEAVGALERIGATRAASLVRQALAVFPDKTPSALRATRQAQLEAMREHTGALFKELDHSWYRDIEDLETLLAAYLRSHPIE